VDARLAGDDQDRLRTLVAGAVARAAAYSGSQTEQAKVTTPSHLTRRSVFTFWTPEYVGAPLIDPGRCVASQGCKACVEICPQDALTWRRGRVRYDISACEPCGRCVTRCPTGAVENPTVTSAMIEAQIRAYVAESPRPVGLAFICSRGEGPELTGDWFPIEVPCASMATSAWLLAPLLMGAAAATAIPCGAVGCPLQQDESVASHRAHARSVLDAFGLSPERVPDVPGSSLAEVLSKAPLSDPFGVHGGAETVLSLFRATDMSQPIRVDGVGSPVGVIEIDEDLCTGCTACVESCPTGALFSEAADGMLKMTFDGSLCTACGQCAPPCPEAGAIALRYRTDTAALAGGSRVLYLQPIATCEICGKPIASESMLDRLGELLGEDHAGTLRLISRRCLDCRGAW
ncbi:MAG: 4Fe-4S binding protein, partial [Acidimicrobiia bacterium]